MMTESISVMISEQELTGRIREIGAAISRDYAGMNIFMVAILKGSVFFATELAKRIEVPVFMEFMKVKSYGNGTESSGAVTITMDCEESLEGKDVLIVEDIVDSGHTLAYLLEEFGKRNPKSIRICTLLDKPERRITPVKVDYTGFTIPDRFVVGYGLDYAQKYRNLPYIGAVEMKEEN